MPLVTPIASCTASSSRKMYLIENTSFVSKAFGNTMMAREGDLIEALDGNIFDVKGLVHPPDKVIAFIRFTPDTKGERSRNSQHYKKVYPLQDRYELLKERFPQYLVFDHVFNEWLCEVPINKIKTHYEPEKYLNQLRRKKVTQELEKQTLQLAQSLKQEASVPWKALGVSGSLLVNLQSKKSDIDLIVYGSANCQKVHNALKLLIQDETSQVRSYTRSELKALFDFRSKDTNVSFEDFVRTESRKVLQGNFRQRDYFIRCIKEENEIDETYGSTIYEPAGEAKIKATIIDNSEMIYTPCRYDIQTNKVLEGTKVQHLTEIVSFRGRFCEQARIGEEVVSRGKVERVKRVDEKSHHFRLLLGNKPSDFLTPA